MTPREAKGVAPDPDDQAAERRGSDEDTGPVKVRINPKLWQHDRHVAADGRVFTHEPSGVSESEYKQLREHKTQYGDSSIQTLVRAGTADDDE